MDQNSRKEIKEKKERITKKDLIYGFIILDLIILIIGLIIAFVFGKYEDPKVIIDQISFTASITSIILAGIAIVYAFFQSREASSQSSLVHEGLKQINERIAQFISIKDEVILLREDWNTQSQQIKNSVETIKGVSTSLEQISSSVAENGEKDPQKIKNELAELSKKMDKVVKDIESEKRNSNLSYGTYTFPSNNPKLKINDGYISTSDLFTKKSDNIQIKYFVTDDKKKDEE